MREASREVANVTERKNLHTHVCLSACLLFDLLYNQNQKPFETKFARLAARAVIGSLFLLKKQQIHLTLWTT